MDPAPFFSCERDTYWRIRWLRVRSICAAVKVYCTHFVVKITVCQATGEKNEDENQRINALKTYNTHTTDKYIFCTTIIVGTRHTHLNENKAKTKSNINSMGYYSQNIFRYCQHRKTTIYKKQNEREKRIAAAVIVIVPIANKTQTTAMQPKCLVS